MFSFYKNIVLKFSGIIFYTVQGGDGSYERRTQFCKAMSQQTVDKYPFL